MPAALVAPAGSKPGHDEIPAAGFDAERDRVTVGAAIAFGQYEEENDRGRNQTQHEEADEDDGKDDSVRHQDFSSLLEPLFDLKPRLNVRQIAFDSLDHYLGTFLDGYVVQAASSQRASLVCVIEADTPLLSGGDGRDDASHVPLQHIALIVDIVLHGHRLRFRYEPAHETGGHGANC